METKCRICFAAPVASDGAFFELREVVDFLSGRPSRLTAETLAAPLTAVSTPCEGRVCASCATERAQQILAHEARQAASPRKPARKPRKVTRRPWDGSSHPWRQDEE